MLLAGAAVFSSPKGPPPTVASASDVASGGQRIFEQRCAVCHSAGQKGGQGPGLGGVVGRRAASTHFGFTRALRDSGLTWDPATLDRFLAGPAQLVPGTLMPMPVPDAAERHAVIAYLATLTAGPDATGTKTTVLADAGDSSDFRGDRPGLRRHLTLADLPNPYATPSSRNAPIVVEAPSVAQPALPPGFRAEVVAHDLAGPRVLRFSPSGDLFVAESTAGRIRVLRGARHQGGGPSDPVYASGLDQPFGLAFYPPGPHPAWLYVAENNAIVRFAYVDGDTVARASAETVVPRLIEGSGGHWTRDLAFSSDGARMFVSIGSASNVAEGGEDERDRADVLELSPRGGPAVHFADGIRNCSGLAVRPGSSEVWCAANERDGLGDDLVPDYVTRLQQGGFYGWPWYYLGDHEDPRHTGERPDLNGHVIVPDVLLQSHSAPLQIAFYDGRTFPARYQGGAFVTLHGSWNRASRTGPKVVYVPLEGGIATGEYEDFMTGFVVDDESVWARPVGVAVAQDGALFVGDDANGLLWRVQYDQTG